MYHGLGNQIHFSFFMTHFFQSSLKIMFPKHNIEKEREFFIKWKLKLVLLLPLEKISIPMCHVLWEQFYCSCIYTKTERNRLQLFKESS